jgi:hypothetical protein
MGRKCYICFKTEDKDYKKHIQEELNIDMIDKSLNTPINSEDEEYIMKKIREDYLSDTTVTIHLIGEHCAEDKGTNEQKYIKRELQASLYHGEDNTKNGILGVVLPSMKDKIYTGSYSCLKCNKNHNGVAVNNSTTVREFNYNYYIPNGKCSHSEEDRYCVLIDWDNFTKDAEKYIEQAFQKRTASISEKTKVRPQ